MRREVVDRHLRDLADMVAELQRHREKSPEELRADRTALLAVEHALQRAIQNVLDIGTHILVSAGVNDWDDYQGVIQKLGEKGLIPLEFARRIGDMAGMRNILVHAYTDVDVEKIRDVLRDELDDFNVFAGYIVDYLEEQEGDR